MSRPSSIDKMPEEFRSLIGQLRGQGWTIDQIHQHLSDLLDEVPSRSAVGRHVHGLKAVVEKARRSRQVAEAVVRELGDAPESKTARLNIELLHSAILDLHMRASDGEDVDEDGKAALNGNPMGAMMIAKALDHLASASKKNVEFIEKAEKRAEDRAKKQAAKTVETIGREKGVSAGTIDAIKAAIFGVKPS